MSDLSKQVILKYLITYLKLKKIPYKKCGIVTMIKCPFCNKEPFTANILPNTNIVKCLPCEKTYNLIDIVNHVDFKAKEKTDDEIIQYIKELLKIDVVTRKEEKNIDEHLDFYVECGFDLLPLVKDKKIPIKDSKWRDETHKEKSEWLHWIDCGLNLGIKTGIKSDILAIDIDALSKPEKKEIRSGNISKERKEELLKFRKERLDKVYKILKPIMGKPLIQENLGGHHLLYKYDKDIPKTYIEIEGIHLDIEAEGGYLLSFPSKLPNSEIKFKELNEIPKLPKEFKKFLLAKIKPNNINKTYSEIIREAIKTEEFKIDPKQFLLKNNNLKGCCNTEFIKLGGILRKTLNAKQTVNVLNVLNRHMLEKPMEQKVINAMARELEKYIVVDEQDLAYKIVDYLREIDSFSSKNDIELSVTGGFTSGENKQRINKAIAYLVKEDKIIQKGQTYKLIKSMNWEDDLLNTGQVLNFKIPYLDSIAYLNKEDLILIGSKTKYGKCLGKGTEVLMANGETKKVENIKKGDKIQGINNKKRTVIETCVGYDNMYEINPVNNDKFIVNGEHILCLYHIVKKEYQTITVKDYLNKSKYYKRMALLYTEPVNWEEKPLEIDPYFLGLWLGDGNSADVRITNIDKEIIDYLHQYAKKLKFKVSKHIHRKGVFGWGIVKKKRKDWKSSDSVQQRLRKLNLLYNKHIPFDYKINSRKNRLKILAGLIDSDGYLNKQNNFEVSFKNKKLAEDLAFIARSLGFSASLTKGKASFNTIRYRIWISGKTYLIPTKIKRKKAKKIKRIKKCNHSGFKLKKLNKEKYYGFTLNGDKKYLLKNFIVNHNTTLAMNFVQRLVKQGLKPCYIYNESGGRFKKTALKLGMKTGDFEHVYCKDAEEVILKKDSITIYDWVKPKDFAKTDDLFNNLVEKVKKANGVLICFVQLKSKKGQENEFFAENQISQFPALICKYIYDKDDDGTYTKFHIEAVRDAKILNGKKTFDIPCRYNFDTREVKTIEEIEKEKE